MVKRQQQQDFLPTKAIQPQQQITDNFIATNPASVNQSELVEIGQALSDLSPTLQQFEERDRAEDAARMELVAGKMSLEELRAASKRDFIGLQKKGVIREGESPWAKVALLEAAGKRLVSQTVLPELYKNLDRLSDPNNNETPEALARTILEEQGIDSLYAANAAEQAMQPVIAQFTNRVSESKAARTAKQNRDDLTDSLRAKFLTFNKSAPPSDREAFVKTIKDEIDKAHSDLGISGRNEAWNALSSAAEEMTRNGDYEGALELLESVETMKIGDKEFGFDFADKRDKLEDDLDDINARVETDEYNEETRRLTKNNRIVVTTAAELFDEQSQAGTEWNDPTTMRAAIVQKLRDADIDENEISALTAKVMKEYRTFQGASDKDDSDTVTEISMMILDDSASLESTEFAIKTAMENNLISQKTGINLLSTVQREKDVSDKIWRLKSKNQAGQDARRDMEAAVQSKALDGTALSSIRSEYDREYNKVIRQVLSTNPGLNEEELVEKIQESFAPIHQRFIKNLMTDDTAALSDDAPLSVQLGVKAKLAKTIVPPIGQGADAPPKELVADASAGLDFWGLLNTPFTNLKSDMQDAIKAGKTTTQNRLKGDLFAAAKDSANLVSEWRNRYQNPQAIGGYEAFITYDDEKLLELMGDANINEIIQAKAIVGFTLEEIKARKLDGLIPLNADSTGDIPLLNPQHVIIFDGFESIQDWSTFATKATDDIEAGVDSPEATRFQEVIDALPPNYRTDADTIAKAQTKLFMRYRGTP